MCGYIEERISLGDFDNVAEDLNNKVVALAIRTEATKKPHVLIAVTTDFGNQLFGRVYGHPRFGNGVAVYTSAGSHDENLFQSKNTVFVKIGPEEEAAVRAALGKTDEPNLPIVVTDENRDREGKFLADRYGLPEFTLKQVLTRLQFASKTGELDRRSENVTTEAERKKLSEEMEEAGQKYEADEAKGAQEAQAIMLGELLGLPSFLLPNLIGQAGQPN